VEMRVEILLKSHARKQMFGVKKLVLRIF